MNITDILLPYTAISQTRTVGVDIKDEATPPYAVVTFGLYGRNKIVNGSAVPWSNLHKTMVLIAYDSPASPAAPVPSIVAQINGTPSGLYDQVILAEAVLSGAFTAIEAAYNANVNGGNKMRKRCQAAAAVLVSSGMILAALGS
jgi:hypothetical protein